MTSSGQEQELHSLCFIEGPHTPRYFVPVYSDLGMWSSHLVSCFYEQNLCLCVFLFNCNMSSIDVKQ